MSAAPILPLPQPPRAAKKHVRIGDLLLQSGRITEAQLEQAIALQKRTGERLGSALVREGYITEEELKLALSGQLGIEAATNKDLDIDPELVGLLPDDFVKRAEVVPVRFDGNTLTIAMVNPNNLAILDEVAFITGARTVRPVVATEMSIRRIIEQHYSTHALLKDIIQSGGLFEKALKFHKSYVTANEDEGKDVYQLQIESEAAPIVSLCNYLLVEAVRRRASDIHIEPYDEFFRIRMRIDGMLHRVLSPPPSLHRPILSRLKIMANMDISKTRVPQDGHIGIEYMGEVLHYRVNTLPTVFGEKCVVRMLKKEAQLSDLDRVGIPQHLIERFTRAIEQPQGLILVTGPTGSGKTSTVHACLHRLNRIETNIVTLENPVEADIPGINHVQIHSRGGVTFMEGLKAILRQDPDVVFLGEIRDKPVAKIAMEAAMTGHMVFSTLHTNGAIESLTRLDDMGVEMFLVAGALRCVVAQRLIRRICPQCKRPTTPDIPRLLDLGVSMDDIAQGRYFVGRGCNHCMLSGFKGRVAVYEILFIDDDIRRLIRTRASVEEIEEVAHTKGMTTLRQAGLGVVLDGLTTVDEMIRCLGVP